MEITTEVRDSEAILAACRRLRLADPIEQSVRLFSGTITGLSVILPDWRYPLVCQPRSERCITTISRALGRAAQTRSFHTGICRGEGTPRGA